MKCRHQRSALAAGGHIAAAEIGYYRNVCELSQQSRVVDLQAVARAVPQAGLVAHRLAMRADGSDGAGGQATGAEQGLHDLGVAAHQSIGCQRGMVQLIVARAVQRQQLLFECG